MAAGALKPRGRSARAPTTNMYFTRLSFQLRFLNFNANRGTSLTKKKENMSMNRNRNRALKRPLTRKGNSPTIILPQNRALAGVGKPIKLVV